MSIIDLSDLSNYSFDAIIFDCDGTLVDSAPLHFSAFKVALAQQGASLDKSWYMDRLGLSRKELITAFSNHCSTKVDIALAVTESETQFLIQSSELNEVPEIANIAKHYYGKVPMAVASSGQRRSVHESLKSTGLAHLFDLILTCDDISVCKPDPEIYIMAAEGLKTNVSKCLVFEDSDEGLMSASSAGTQVIDVRPFTANHAGIG